MRGRGVEAKIKLAKTTKAAAKLPIETVAAVVLFLVISYILLGPYLLGWLKGTVEKWTSPQKPESNSISLALCEYRQGRAEYPFEWFSRNEGDLREVAAGLSDCEWMKEAKLEIDVKSGPEITSCKTLPTPEPVSSCADAGGTCRLPTPDYCLDAENDAGVADCGPAKHCCIIPTSINAYLVPDPTLLLEEQYRMSSGNTYKVIAERVSDAEVPDVCMCVTTDLQRHECW